MIFTIFKKELKETLRDRRTLLAMIIIPVLVFPILIGGIASITKHLEEEERNKTFTIAVGTTEPNTFTSLLVNSPTELGTKNIRFVPPSIEPTALLKDDSIDVVIHFNTDFDATEGNEQSNKLTVFYEGKNVMAKAKAEAYINYISAQLLEERLLRKNIPYELLSPLHVEYENKSSDKEMIGKLAGGFLPYLFIIFGFIGCMYPAIDLFTGEKERKTLETILTTPLPRWKILVGKMCVVVTSGLAASTFALFGLFFGIRYFGIIEDESIMEVVQGILSIRFIVTLYLLLLPLTIFFAGILIPITTYAKSFKEAQSIITPLNFIVIAPVFIGFLPSFELSATTALIPIVNIVLASKELIAGTIVPLHLIIVFLTMLVLATIAILISNHHFGKESNIV